MDDNERIAAFRLLELGGDATEEEIKGRYNVLLKKYRFLVQEGMPADKAAKELESIDGAYRLLLGYNDQDEDSPGKGLSGRGLPDSGKGSGKSGYKIFSRKWIENFLYHYKYRVLGLSFIGLVVALIIAGYVTRPDYDINISFVGEIYALDIDKIKSNIVSGGDIIKEPRIDMNSMPNPVENNFQASIRERLTVNMAVGAIDVCITDEPYLKEYCLLGVFMPLESAIRESGIDTGGLKQYVLKGKDSSGEERVYGIDISGSAAIRDAGVMGDRMIFAIMENASNYENCVELLRILAK